METERQVGIEVSDFISQSQGQQRYKRDGTVLKEVTDLSSFLPPDFHMQIQRELMGSGR